MNKKKNKFRNAALIIVMVIIVLVMFSMFNRGDTGEYIAYSQARQIVELGKYSTEQKGEDGNNIVKETGFATHIYVVGGNGYIKVENTGVEGKTFPKFADYHFTYNNTTEDLSFIQTFNSMVDAANRAAEKGETTF